MSATVNAYLSAINTPKKRGRKVTRVALEQRLMDARARAKTATGVDKVVAAQAIRDLQTKIVRVKATVAVDVKSLEAVFTDVAKRFGENRGISYGSWRDAGVPAVGLQKARVAQTRA